MEKEYTYSEITAILDAYVQVNMGKGPWTIIGKLQAHLAMSLTGMDADYIIKHLKKDIKEFDGTGVTM